MISTVRGFVHTQSCACLVAKPVLCMPCCQASAVHALLPKPVLCMPCCPSQCCACLVAQASPVLAVLPNPVHVATLLTLRDHTHSSCPNATSAVLFKSELSAVHAHPTQCDKALSPPAVLTNHTQVNNLQHHVRSTQRQPQLARLVQQNSRSGDQILFRCSPDLQTNHMWRLDLCTSWIHSQVE
jgi:hypothetical protein